MPNDDTREPGWTRSETAAHVAEFATAATEGMSQRAYARARAVPRTTLQYWMERKETLDASPTVAAFFESPDGVALLHRLVVAVQFVIGYVGSNGLRSVGLVLELAGLDRFVANSFGTRQKLGRQMETHICAFGGGQREQLAPQMASKSISVCEDETFHPATCLVAIEPVSDFILLERYAEHRDAATWDAAVREAIRDLPVRVIQSTSDEGKGLLAHVRTGLGAHHSPDLFHVQQELTRATSVALASRVRHAEQAADDAATATQAARQEAQSFAERPRGPGRAPDFDARIAAAEAHQQAAAQALKTTRARQEQSRQAIRGIGRSYHPVALQTGAIQGADDVTGLLEQHFAQIQKVAQEAALPERCLQGIAKAHRLVGALGCTVAFFHQTVRARIDQLGLTAEWAQWVEQSQVPAAYLERAARKASTADDRADLRERAEERKQVPPPQPASTEGPDAEQRAHIDTAVQECADLFQRSSSCVEGRNGQLALRHHCLHNLSPTRLEALTHVHNYFLRRPDGTTAAQRFFGLPHADLFQSLLDHLDLPARPAAPRPRPTRASSPPN